MTTEIVSCRTLEAELTKAMRDTGTDFPVHWLESGLHDTPRKLTAAFEALFAELRADRVLLAMGYCGNSVAGLRAGAFELIIPRADDCITLLLGSHARREEIGREKAAYFLTEGWMRGDRNLWAEYQAMVEDYGEELARELAADIYAPYRTLALLDSGVEPVEPLVEKTRIIAETLRFRQEVVPATLSFLEQLLTGPWPETRFLRIPPGGTVDADTLLVFPE